MPELPEVETTKTSLTPLIGKTVADIVVSDKRLREPIPSLKPLIGMTLKSVHRRAKYLLLDFVKPNQRQDKQTLLIHLGMSGSLGQSNHFAPRKHDHVVFAFDDQSLANFDKRTHHAPTRYLCYHDPRRFGMVMWADDGLKYLTKLGIEPLSDSFNGHYLYQKIHQNQRPSHRPIKAVIMEQAIVVGVGNIYASESLFLAGIHPKTPAHLLSLDKLNILAEHIKMILTKAIAVGGSSLKDFSVGDNQTGYFQQTLNVYGQQNQPCSTCQTPLDNVKITGRASVFCPTCQPFIKP